MTVVYLDPTDRAAIDDVRRGLDLHPIMTNDMVLRTALHAYARLLREEAAQRAAETPETPETPALL